MCNKKATFGRALPRRFNVSLLREPHIALPIKDNELIRSSREERERETGRWNYCLFSSFSFPFERIVQCKRFIGRWRETD